MNRMDQSAWIYLLCSHWFIKRLPCPLNRCMFTQPFCPADIGYFLKFSEILEDNIELISSVTLLSLFIVFYDDSSKLTRCFMAPSESHSH